MSKFRRAAKVDANQPEIVKALRDLGISVQLGHDDILVGYNGKTYWFEIKVNDKSEIKSGQKLLALSWKGHYSIVTSAEQILQQIGYMLE